MIGELSLFKRSVQMAIMSKSDFTRPEDQKNDREDSQDMVGRSNVSGQGRELRISKWPRKSPESGNRLVMASELARTCTLSIVIPQDIEFDDSNGEGLREYLPPKLLGHCEQ
jgi:hypothetical protein